MFGSKRFSGTRQISNCIPLTFNRGVTDAVNRLKRLKTPVAENPSFGIQTNFLSPISVGWVPVPSSSTPAAPSTASLTLTLEERSKKSSRVSH